MKRSPSMSDPTLPPDFQAHFEQMAKEMAYKHRAGCKSLRTVAPDYWSAPDTLHFKSIIASYAYGPIEDYVGEEVAKFIKGNVRSATRLRRVAFSAYESFAVSHHLPSYVSIGSMTVLALTSGVSALDAYASALSGMLLGKASAESRMPSMSGLKNHLANEKPAVAEAIEGTIGGLLSADWFREMTQARHRVVHRGYWPQLGEHENFLLCREGETFAYGQRTVPPDVISHPLDLTEIMKGLLCEFEAWDLGLEPLLKKHACFASFLRGPMDHQSDISGRAESDWSLGGESASFSPTPALIQKFKEHDENARRALSSESERKTE